MRFRSPACSLLVTALLLPACGLSGDPLSTDSPFAPASATPVTAGTNEVWQLTGLTMTAGQTQVCLWQAAKKQHTWLPLGGKVDDLTVLSCDFANDTIVVRTTAGEKTLRLKKSQGPTVGVVTTPPPSPAPAPVLTTGLPPPPPPPQSKEEQVEEARNFIGDMLEIGQRQREAYEEAQRKAGAEKAAKSPNGKP